MNLRLLIAFLFKESYASQHRNSQQSSVESDLWVKILLFIIVQTWMCFPLFQKTDPASRLFLFLCRRSVYKQICGCLYIMEQFQLTRWMNQNVWIFVNKRPDRDLLQAVNLPVKNSLCYGYLLLWSWKMECTPPACSDLDSKTCPHTSWLLCPGKGQLAYLWLDENHSKILPWYKIFEILKKRNSKRLGNCFVPSATRKCRVHDTLEIPNVFML